LIKHGLDGQNFDEIKGSGGYFLPILILQAIFLPAQGFFNAIVYFRPKYMQAKRKYKSETFIWYVRRSIIGEKLKPAGNNFNTSADTLDGPTRSKRITFAGEMQSSYSNSMAPIPETLRIPHEGAGQTLPSMLESTTESMFETTEDGKE
jgi:hypothetical protein